MENASVEKNNQARKWKLLGFLTVIAACLIGYGTYWFFYGRYWVSTDNAYVMADSARISSRVPGTVHRMLVENDQMVTKDQVLVELDPRDYQAAVDRERAAVKRIQAKIEALTVSIRITDTQTAAKVQAATNIFQQAIDKKQEGNYRLKQLERRRIEARADLDKARRDFRRYDKLFRVRAISEERLDSARTVMIKAEARLNAIDAELEAVKASLAAIEQEVQRAAASLRVAESDRYRLEVLRHELKGLKAQLEEARASLKRAELNLSYCRIAAPISGYIAEKHIQLGDRIQPGQALMAVVPLQDVYVEANFKETQLENIRLGQPVTIKADIYSGYEYPGRVVGIRAGTGAAFSLLPPENATGNWIKVVQRIPVKIRLDSPPPANYPLRVGASLDVTVDTRNRSGAVLVFPMPKP
ncbi:MAG: HlyD family secretion protein [Deltaproteobacteria bacterium]|nr:HlyD family secretion protein [Deltaproteobacteria bacterium]MBW1962272.1 HlyD family secretion protein [Deltaproteobacteria bacterium]MBW2153825.1 HlyD family secretion protein [Deltaproteobacteria bacterium]